MKKSLMIVALLTIGISAAQAQNLPVAPGNQVIYRCETKLDPPVCYRINGDGTVTQITKAKVPLLPADGKKVYKCYVDGYDPPVCIEVPIQGKGGFSFDIESIDPKGLAQAMAAALIYKDRLAKGQAVNIDDPLTEGCANSHGQSGCCRIIGTDPITGTMYIECG